MKVVLLNKTAEGGGAAVAANRLYHALNKSDVEVSFLVQDQTDNTRVQSICNTKKDSIKAFIRFVKERLYFLPHEKNKSFRYSFSPANTGIDITNHPLILEADVIHIHWINQGFLSLKTLDKLFKLGKPIVWTLHDMWSFTGGCHYAGTCFEFIESCGHCQFLKNPHKNDLSAKHFLAKKIIWKNIPFHIVSCSKWLKSLANESSLLRNKQLYNIPNPIDLEIYRPKNRIESRKSLGLPSDKKLILFGAANTEDPRKGMRYLIEALNILGENFPLLQERLNLVVFGKSKKGTFDMPFTTHQLNFVSDQDQLVSLYNAADAFILPSLQDNLPNTVMESLACGTPVIGFRVGGVPEMIDHLKTGYLAEVRNSLSLATGIYEVIFGDQTEKMRLKARKVAEKRYDEKIVAEQYIQVYKDAIENTGK
ncbi:glycosyltransferase family 4 protein [bacterium]|nr:glycosyltransferase family 4 protein [bacterium]